MKNNLGLSTGCYYPRLTEDIIKDISETGVSLIELFINTDSEMSDGFIRELNRKLEFYGISVGSVHPFTSFAESYLFFSDYPRRRDDGIRIYDRYFEICNMLGAKIVNFHGMLSTFKASFERYCEGYGLLYERAKKTGVIFSQENVRNHVCGDIEYIRRFSEKLGNDVAFTFDVKQAHMMGYDPLEFIRVVSDKLCLVHLNDFDKENPCLLPGCGTFETEKFISYLNSVGYSGNYVIEVYSGNYSDETDILRSVQHTNKILKEWS